MISDEMIPHDLSPDDLRWSQMVPDEIFDDPAIPDDPRRAQMIPEMIQDGTRRSQAT